MKIKWWLVGLAFLPLMATIIAYPHLPEQVATHWGINGKPNGYSPKSMQVVLAGMPLIIYVLMMVVPQVDPKKENYQLHNKAYTAVILSIVSFLILLNALTLVYNLGYPIPIDKPVTFGIGIMMMVLGNFMGQFRHNYFVGIRTPWTLASEEVWRKTHRLSGKFYMLAGMSIAISSFFGGMAAFVVTMGSLFLISGAAVLYSYLLFIKLGSK